MPRERTYRVSASEARTIRKLSSDLGERRFRTLMQSDYEPRARPISKKQLDNLERGTGRLNYEQQHRVALIQSNAGLLKKLGDKSSSKTNWRTNRAMRDWLVFGKDRGTPYDKGTRKRAIKGLGYLGVDPTEGTFYVIRRKS